MRPVRVASLGQVFHSLHALPHPGNWEPGEGRSVKTTWPVLEWIVHSASDQVKHSQPGGANSPSTSSPLVANRRRGTALSFIGTCSTPGKRFPPDQLSIQWAAYGKPAAVQELAAPGVIVVSTSL